MSICLIDDDDWFRDMFCQYMVDCFHGIDITSELPDDWKKGKNAGEAGEYRECDLYIFGGAGPEYLPEDPDDGILEKSLFLCCREDEISEARKRFPNINMIYKFISATKLVEHIVVIEDSAELQIRGIENIVRLETKNANAQGKGMISMQDLVKASLRMRPDRIIVGEVRGKEVVDLITAMNTGHDGGMSTIHANAPQAVFGRLETMFLSAAPYPADAVRGQIASGIDVVVHLSRLRDGTRRVMDISEFLGYDGGRPVLNSIFRFQKEAGTKGMLEPTGNSLKHTEKMQMRGGDLYEEEKQERG